MRPPEASSSIKERRLYQIREIAISLVRVFHAALGLEPELLPELDLDNMKLGSTEYVNKEGSKSMSDLVWKIPSLNVLHPFILYLLIEFQSTFERNMVDRVVDYASQLEKREQQNRKPGKSEIRLRAVSVFTGKHPWTPSAYREPPSHHQSVMPLGYQYGRVIDARRLSLQGLDQTELAVLAMRLEQAATAGEAISILGEVFDHYEEEHIGSAFHGRVVGMDFLTRADGSRVSYEQLLMEHKGGTMPQAEQTRFEEFFEEHRIQAINEGQIEGRREMLRRMAARRFDAETVERFAERLRTIDDPARLTDIFDALFDCETAEELLALVG